MGKFLMFRGRPIARNKANNEIYYGYMNEKSVVRLVIESYKTDDDGNEVEDKILVQQILTDPTIPITEAIVSNIKKSGLHKALVCAADLIEKTEKDGKAE